MASHSAIPRESRAGGWRPGGGKRLLGRAGGGVEPVSTAKSSLGSKGRPSRKWDQGTAARGVAYSGGGKQCRGEKSHGKGSWPIQKRDRPRDEGGDIFSIA